MVPSVAYAATATMAGYRERVIAARGAVESALQGGADEDAARDLAETIGALLPAAEQVEVGGTEVAVDNSTLHGLLDRLDAAETGSARREIAGTVLEQLISQEAAVGTAGTAPPHDVAALDRILEDEGLSGAGAAQSELTERVREFVNRLIEWLTEAGDSPAVKTSFRLVWYALLVLSAVAVIRIATLVVRRLRSSGIGRDARVSNPDDVPVVAAAEGLPDDALAFADGEAAAGRFREAVRALFGAAARELVERGVVSRTQTRTTRELLGDVESARPTVAPSLHALASTFEPAWYGHVDPGDTGYTGARLVYVALLDTLDSAGDAA